MHQELGSQGVVGLSKWTLKSLVNVFGDQEGGRQSEQPDRATLNKGV